MEALLVIAGIILVLGAISNSSNDEPTQEESLCLDGISPAYHPTNLERPYQTSIKTTDRINSELLINSDQSKLCEIEKLIGQIEVGLSGSVFSPDNVYNSIKRKQLATRLRKLASELETEIAPGR